MDTEWNVIVTRFESMCYGCGGMIKKNSIAWHNRELRQARHLNCKNKDLSCQDLD